MKFFGGLLMAIGILIATLSGLCSAVLLLGMVKYHGFSGTGVGIAVVAGVLFFAGVGLFLVGLDLVRGEKL